MLVATIKRPPQRTIDSTLPTPGTVSPRATFQTPSGPSRIADPPTTSRTVHPSIVVGFVSGKGVQFGALGPGPIAAPVDAGAAGTDELLVTPSC